MARTLKFRSPVPAIAAALAPRSTKTAAATQPTAAQAAASAPAGTVTEVQRGRNNLPVDETATIVAVSKRGDFQVVSADLDVIPSGMLKADCYRLAGRRLIQANVTGPGAVTLTAGALVADGLADAVGVLLAVSVPLTEALPNNLTVAITYTDADLVARTFNCIIRPLSHSFEFIVFMGDLLNGQKCHMNARMIGDPVAPQNFVATIGGISANTVVTGTALCQGSQAFVDYVVGRVF